MKFYEVTKKIFFSFPLSSLVGTAKADDKDENDENDEDDDNDGLSPIGDGGR